MKPWMIGILFALVTGCAGMNRGCSSDIATTFGADWLVTQIAADGHIVNCWALKDRSITNEHASDGIYWKDGDGNLVHISGWYNRVQVNNGNWKAAATSLGVEEGSCPGGRYGGGAK